MYVAIGYNPPTISTEGRTSLPFQLFMKVSKFSAWKKLNASYGMSATDFPPRCKDKNYLANDVHVSRIFAKILLFLKFNHFNKKYYS